MRIYYSCYYDGNECDKAIPRVDERGNIIPEPHEVLERKYGHCVERRCIEEGWDKCDECSRNHSLSATCHGVLKIGN